MPQLEYKIERELLFGTANPIYCMANPIYCALARVDRARPLFLLVGPGPVRRTGRRRGLVSCECPERPILVFFCSGGFRWFGWFSFGFSVIYLLFV
jgi:hypothetical protein